MARLTKKQMAEQVTVTCYRQTETMTRKEAIDFYREGMMSCDPGSSECGRYTSIFFQLMEGLTEVTDEIEYF